MHSGRRRPNQNQLDGREDVEGVVHDQGLSYVPKFIEIELISHFGIEKSSRAHCKECLAVANTDTYLLLGRLIDGFATDRHIYGKGTSYDLVLVVIDRHTRVTT